MLARGAVAAVVAGGLLVAACGDGARRGGKGGASEPVIRTESLASAEQRDDLRPAQRYVDLARGMSLTERAGQLVMTKVDGTSLSAEQAGVIEREHLGGVILFAFNYESAAQLRSLLAQVQRAGRAGNALGAGVVVAVDQEGGAVRRLPGIPPERSQVELGRLGSVPLARQEGERAGRALARVGVHLNLAPVADLAVGPLRTMAYRSYGASPTAVARLVAASVTGMQRGGVSAAPKHFPGFGAASVNSDFGVAHVTRSRAQVMRDDMAPFRAAVGAGTDAIMVSHGIYDAIDPGTPASISTHVVGGMLREGLGFDGVVITDSLNAKGLRGAWRGTVPQACAEAVGVGVDIALVTGSLETAMLCRQRIAGAVRSGRISEERLIEAVARVLALKDRRGLLPAAVDGDDSTGDGTSTDGDQAG